VKLVKGGIVMKRMLFGTTALAGAAIAVSGLATAAETPTWKLGGNVTFQLYYVDQDFEGFSTSNGDITAAFTTPSVGEFKQDHDWYFGVDEAEIKLDVTGTADNGLNYGFKIEINANTSDGTVADEVRLQFSGGWGTLQLGDDDGAEDVMNYGGEDLLGAAGGFDDSRGEYRDVLIRYAAAPSLAPSFAVIAGDTSDQTKVSYFSPRFSGLQVGASLTPTPNDGDAFKVDGAWEDHIGLGANYDNSFGELRIRASAVYSAASDTTNNFEDVSAWSVGGIVGWGPFSLGAGYTDNGDSAQPAASGDETSYWNAAVGFETGPFKLAAGYFESTKEHGSGLPDSSFTNIAVTADYSLAPGLGLFAELDLIEDDVLGSLLTAGSDNDATVFLAGANVSF
jgi:predicted porin